MAPANSSQYEQVLKLPAAKKETRPFIRARRAFAVDGLGGGFNFEVDDDGDTPSQPAGAVASEDFAPTSQAEDPALEAQVATVHNQKTASGRPRGAGRKPPRAGPRFPRNDSVKSKRPPPGDCRVCGSPFHWDRDCPHWNEYDIGRQALFIGAEHDCDAEENEEYNQAFVAYICSNLNNARLSSALWADIRRSEGEYLKATVSQRRRTYAVVVEDEPEPSTLPSDSLPPNHPFIMEDARPERAAEERLEGMLAEALAVDGSTHHLPERRAFASTKSTASESFAPVDPTASEPFAPVDATAREPFAPVNASGLPPPESKVVMIPRIRDPPAGHSTVGVAALSFQLRFGSLSHPLVTCRADSGADISLISQEYLETLPSASRPKIRQGLRMNLFQLTGGFRITGYVQTQVYVETEQGHVLKMVAECYVVPGMSAPLLLGEDFHVNYELSVTRSLAEGSAIKVSDTGYSIPASSAVRHERPRLKRDRPTAVAQQDVRISPHSCCSVPIQVDFSSHKSWFIEKTVLGQPDGSFLLTTPTIIDAEHACIPVTNPTDRPYIVRRGESLGLLHDPDSYFSPSSTE
ncbi:uncharacterized protein B0H18DRAFT_885162, partial [Fomitopsis serialis]|uniref:uncharacterized protein n=1 Tax=Fomitopsis serialis TaxID=139415 RepID=UPI002008CC04